MHRNIIPIVKPARCTNVSNLFILEWQSTYFGRSFRPSSGVQDCTYSNRYLFDKCLLLYVQSWTPDDGRKDLPKHVECYSKINKLDTLVHLAVFTIGITHCFVLIKQKWSVSFGVVIPMCYSHVQYFCSERK